MNIQLLRAVPTQAFPGRTTLLICLTRSNAFYSKPASRRYYLCQKTIVWISLLSCGTQYSFKHEKLDLTPLLQRNATFVTCQAQVEENKPRKVKLPLYSSFSTMQIQSLWLLGVKCHLGRVWNDYQESTPLLRIRWQGEALWVAQRCGRRHRGYLPACGWPSFPFVSHPFCCSQPCFLSQKGSFVCLLTLLALAVF